MNISETATASATANELSEVVPPSSGVAFTRIGSPTTASTSSEKARFSRASRPNVITRSSSARSAEPAGSSRARLLEDRLGALEPEHVERLPQERVLAAGADQVEQLERLLGDPLRERRVRRLDLRLDRVLHVLALRRVLGVEEDLDRARLERGLDVRREVLRDDERAEHLAVAHLLDRLLAAVHAHRLDRVEEALALLPRGRSARRPARRPPPGPRGRCRTRPPACPGRARARSRSAPRSRSGRARAAPRAAASGAGSGGP